MPSFRGCEKSKETTRKQNSRPTTFPTALNILILPTKWVRDGSPGRALGVISSVILHPRMGVRDLGVRPHTSYEHHYHLIYSTKILNPRCYSNIKSAFWISWQFIEGNKLHPFVHWQNEWSSSYIICNWSSIRRKNIFDVNGSRTPIRGCNIRLKSIPGHALG